MSLWKDFRQSLSIRADNTGLGVQLPPWDDYWYTNRGYQTATGLRVSPENALRIAAVFACVRVVSETVASLPCVIYRRLPDGGKERANEHPLYQLLHDSPNPWQTSYEFWEMMQGHLELRGNAYAEIVSGNGRAIDMLVPIHPDRVIVRRLPGTGRLKYEIRNFYTGALETRAQEEMFHLRGISADGLVGMSTISIMAESIGAGMAAQEYAARFFENDATPSGILKYGRSLTESAYERLKSRWRTQNSGPNQHSLKILEDGMDYTPIGVTNKDSQLLEARQFSRSDIASGFRVPLHKIGDLSRATFSNIEQQNIEFATDCIRPRIVRLERRINFSLVNPLQVGDGEEYFCEFLMEALLRGDLPSRYSAYATGIQWGWLSPNDVRTRESMNPIEGGDTYLRPLNMVPAEQADPNAPDDNSDAQEDSTGSGAEGALLGEYVRAAAERVVRKEVKSISRISESANGHFVEQLAEFYEGHRDFVMEVMRLPRERALEYTSMNERSLVEAQNREQAIRSIELRGAEVLTQMALARVMLTCAQAMQPMIQPVHVTVEPQTINVTPQISVAAPNISVQPMDVRMLVEQAPARPKKVTASRDANGKLQAVIEEQPALDVKALPGSDGVKIDGD